MAIRILSLDGGGIRGIIPALVLAEVERLTGRPIATLFDLIAGTSTGGILALGLVTPDPQGRPAYSAADLARLYEREGPDIFAAPFWRRIPFLGNLFEEKYSAKAIERVLREYFGDARLSQALIDVIVPSYEIENRIPWFFKSSRARTDATRDFLMRDVARATSAAPTYFEPHPLANYALIDGGVYANNPALCAYVEARTLHPEAADFLVVSIGTGQATTPIPYRKAKGWGLGGWAKPILDVVFDGINDTIDYQLAQLLPLRTGGVRRHYRFQAELRPGEDTLDDASDENLRRLKEVAAGIIRSNAGALGDLARELIGGPAAPSPRTSGRAP